MYSADEFYGDDITSGVADIIGIVADTQKQLRRQAPAPDIETLMEWMEDDGGCEATDGCWVEPDGTCEHGAKSWLIVYGLI